jgi:hypothetical protein
VSVTGQVQSKRRDSFLGRIRDFSRADPDANVAVREPGRGDRSDSADRNSNQERSSNPSSTFHAPETVQEAFNSRLLPNEWLRLSNAYSDYTPLSIPREEYIAAIEVGHRVVFIVK